MTTLEFAGKYLEMGMLPIPVPKQSKAPIVKGWPDLRLASSDLATHFSNGNNIGVLLGGPSGNLIDIDCDHGLAVSLAPRFLPGTMAVFGRKGKPRSHYLYRVDSSLPTEKFCDEDQSTIVEIRSTGAQTVFPPSIHPTGELIEWNSSQFQITTVSSTELRKAVKCLAAAVLIAKNYPQTPGSRHQIAMALAGGLQKSGWSPDASVHFVESVCVAGGDDEIKDRLRAVQDTERRIKAGQPAIGWTRLTQLLNQNLIVRIRGILDLGNTRLESTEGRDERRANRERRRALAISNPRNLALVHSHNLTDVGNSEFFVSNNSNQFFFCPQYGKFFFWDNILGVWRLDDSGEIVRLAKQSLEHMMEICSKIEDEDVHDYFKKHILASESKLHINAMIDLSKCEVAVKAEHLDNEPYLFKCANGTVHLQTGELIPDEKKHLITKLSPVEYLPDVKAPTWERFLNDIFDGDTDVISFVQRASGYSLTGETKEQCFFFNYGTGANGKSTFLNTILSIVGDYGRQTDPDLLVVKGDSTHPTGLTDLQGIRFASSIEVEEGRRFAEVIIKQLTGGDTITARKMHQDFFSFRPTHKIWLAANHKPNIRGTDHAIWRRVRLIPFEVTFAAEEQDHDLPEKLKTEYPGILRWLVEGAVAWYANGLQPPGRVIEATGEYRKEMDTLANFVSAKCILNPVASTTQSELYACYKKWAEEVGEYCFSSKMFTLKFRERFSHIRVENLGAHRVKYIGIGIQFEGGDRDS